MRSREVRWDSELSGTARAYDLHQDWWYDGEAGPQNPTTAALDYLQSLTTSSIRIGLCSRLTTPAAGTSDAHFGAGVSKSKQRLLETTPQCETSAHVPLLARPVLAMRLFHELADVRAEALLLRV